jgi:signal transduction histidine kinase
MPRGGRLAVTSRAMGDELSLWRDGQRRPEVVEVRFRDSGPGIPEEAQERIFVPFYTTKEKGTGLGLAICQRIVKAHQGTIGVRTPPGGGAEFIVALPGLRDERAPEPDGARHPAPAGGRAGEGSRVRPGSPRRKRRRAERP